MAEYSVLIIDDDIWMQRILSKTLQSYGFNKTFLASNGFEGISLAVEHQPDLIILDILMPELTGHLTLKILKHIKNVRDIPVIMVSALSDVENLGLAVKSGTAGFISKPFTRATVFDKLVDVFGKEKIEKISRGEYVEHPISSGKDASKAKHETGDHEKIPEFEEMNEGDETSKQAAAKNKLLQHYQDDEKRSIESIKKLLLKTRK
ncbi:MAG: PleD family two-component system response regulator [Candidatus Kapaibacterium sp.]